MVKESAPYGLAAVALLVVGASAAIPAALVLASNAVDRPPVAAATGADASPSLSASAHTPMAVTPSASPSATADAKPAPSASGKPAASSSEASGPGFLTIITTPPAKLTLHGRVLCTTTPCSNLSLPPGPHTLTLENKEDSSKTVVTVTITSGETTVKRVKLKTAVAAP